ncbi:unnamed protein product [Staurois parvus]|uniref:Uncharacterized protein n=1 Tax=Staurois parvus TaxID=386267 RepID=A0ABN9F394_9NEOB|nr:unnamed protein product [Staurois parvus]
MGPPTDPGPSGSARVSKWSVRPWPQLFYQVIKTAITIHGKLLSLCTIMVLCRK